MTTHDLKSRIVERGDVECDGPNFHRLVSGDGMSKDVRIKKILSLRPRRLGPGGPRAIEMISNGGTKPGSAVSEWVEVGPRARNVDLTSMSLGDVNAYALTASQKREGLSDLGLTPIAH